MEEEKFESPTGYKEVKTKKGVFYQYVFGAEGGTRFVNTNKRCKNCPRIKKCILGRHSVVMACPKGGNG